MAGVRRLVQYINGHDFWSAQLAQVDITPVGDFELLPTVGNHTIRIGNADSLESKLSRLMLFYKQVASKAGFDKYSVLDVQYAGQVVAVHRGEKSAVDSAALKRNISALLRADQMMAAHTAAEAVADKTPAATDSSVKTTTVTPTATTPKPEVKKEPAAATSKPLPAKKEPVKKAVAETKPKPAATVKKAAPAKKPVVKETTGGTQKKPKAVMQRRE
jgi:cell division protein FtsQ